MVRGGLLLVGVGRVVGYFLGMFLFFERDFFLRFKCFLFGSLHV